MNDEDITTIHITKALSSSMIVELIEEVVLKGAVDETRERMLA